MWRINRGRGHWGEGVPVARASCAPKFAPMGLAPVRLVAPCGALPRPGRRLSSCLWGLLLMCIPPRPRPGECVKGNAIRSSVGGVGTIVITVLYSHPRIISNVYVGCIVGDSSSVYGVF